MPPLVIDPSAMFFGAPYSIAYGGVECGATLSPPKISINPDTFKPKFENAKGFIKGTAIVTFVEATVEVEVNEITAAKLAWAMPGSEEVAGVITWSPGRVPSSAYKDLVLSVLGLDGATFVFTLTNALSVDPLALEFGNATLAGMKLKFEGYCAVDAPTDAPFSIELDAGS